MPNTPVVYPTLADLQAATTAKVYQNNSAAVTGDARQQNEIDQNASLWAHADEKTSGVTASLPLTSSEGPTPNIAIANGTADGQVLQWADATSAWEKHTALNQTTYVDLLNGDDETAQPGNPFLPYETLMAALLGDGVSVVICRGPAPYFITDTFSIGGPFVIYMGAGPLIYTGTTRWNDSNAPITIYGNVIGNFYGTAGPVTINGNLTGNVSSNSPGVGSLVINGNLIGDIVADTKPIPVTINGSQFGEISPFPHSLSVITISGGSCGKVSGTIFPLHLINASVEAITGDDPTHPILVTAQNSTCSQIIENASMQSGSTGNYGFFAEAITFPLGTVTDGTVRLVKFGQPTTIISATVICDDGTTTVAINIAGTPIEGLDAIDITDTESDATATDANLAAIGDYLSFTFSDTASAEGVTITLYYQEIVP